MKDKIEKTFTGCACGLHGYLILPDCETENHGDKCARCILNSERIKGWEDIDIKNMSATQLFSFLSPYIEQAGYIWVQKGDLITIK